MLPVSLYFTCAKVGAVCFSNCGSFTPWTVLRYQAVPRHGRQCQRAGWSRRFTAADLGPVTQHDWVARFPYGYNRLPKRSIWYCCNNIRFEDALRLALRHRPVKIRSKGFFSRRLWKQSPSSTSQRGVGPMWDWIDAVSLLCCFLHMLMESAITSRAVWPWWVVRGGEVKLQRSCVSTYQSYAPDSKPIIWFVQLWLCCHAAHILTYDKLNRRDWPIAHHGTRCMEWISGKTFLLRPLFRSFKQNVDNAKNRHHNAVRPPCRHPNIKQTIDC